MIQTSRILLALTLLTGTLHANDSLPPSATFRGQMEVNLVNLQVVVTAKGEPVTDLTAADFTILEDGEPRAISHFQAVVDGLHPRGTTPAVGRETALTRDAQPQDPSLVVLAFDTMSIPNQQLRRALNAVRESVQKNARADLHWAVVLLGSHPHWLLAPTNDIEQVGAILDGVETGQVTVDRALLVSKRALDPDPRINKESGPPRRNLLLEDLACEINRRERYARNTIHNNALAEVFQAHGATYQSKAVVLTFGSDSEFAICGGELMRPALGVMRVADLYEQAREVAREAATAGFRVYTNNARGLVNPVATMGADPRGMATNTAFDVTNKELAKVIATDTGGDHFESNDLTMSLRAATRDVLTYYSMAFQAPHPHDGEPHRIEVKVARRGVKVRHANELLDLDPRLRLARQLTIPAGFVTSPGKLRLRVELAEPEQSTDRTRTASAVLPLSNLTLIPEGQTVTASVEAFVAVHDADGEVIALEGAAHRLTISADDPALEEPDTEVVLDVPFEEPHGTYTLAMAVIDMVSQDSGFAYSTVAQ